MPEIQRTFQRYEKKYILTPEQFHKLLFDLQAKMKEEEYGLHTICNIYYDTPTYDLIRSSLKKPVYKEKFRLRSYGTPNKDDYIFAEIKKKYNGIVYKRRVEACSEAIQEFLQNGKRIQHNKQIQQEIQWFLHSYSPVPKVFIGYERIALVGEEDSDLRITFDQNIRWRSEELDLLYGDKGELLLEEEKIIMEVKVAATIPLWLVSLLSEYKIYPITFSKYGTCYQRYIAAKVF